MQSSVKKIMFECILHWSECPVLDNFILMRQTQAAQQLGKIELTVNLHFKDYVRMGMIAETSGIERAVCTAYLRQLRSL